MNGVCKLEIANCRGNKPVITEIKRALKLIRDIQIEINPCEGKDSLIHCERLLVDVLGDNGI